MKKIWGWLISPAVGGVVGIVGFAFAIYTAYFYERKPEVSISVDAMSKVFDLYQPVGGLEVSYAGENLRSAKKNLWVLTATIKNVGNAEIRKVDYDDNSPLGLEIKGAVIAERPILKTTVDYLAQNVSISTTESRILFSPVILEAGESFEVTTLLLGSESAKPSIAPMGKLAGIKSIVISTPESPSPGKPVWIEAVDATSIWVHPIRWIIYLLGPFIAFGLLVTLFAIVMTPFDKMKEQRAVADRQRRLRDYRQHEELGRDSRYLIDIYVARGDAGLVAIARYLRAFDRRRALVDTLNGKLEEKDLENVVRSAAAYGREESATEDGLKSVKLAEGDGIRVNVSGELGQALNDLMRFLKIDVEKFLSSKGTDRAAIAMEVALGKYNTDRT